MSLFQIYFYFFHILMFLTVSKSKDMGKIRKVYDLNAFKHFFLRKNFFVNLLIYKTEGNTFIENPIQYKRLISHNLNTTLKSGFCIPNIIVENFVYVSFSY
jgi:hypothetical protein